MSRVSTKIATGDMPYVENYPPLSEFLKKHEARCMWQLPLGGTKDCPNSYVECYSFPRGKGLAIVTVHAFGHGWDIFTPSIDGRVDTALADTVARLKLQEPSK